MPQKSHKILIIRFSSFGDVLQTLSVVSALHQKWPQSEIHWVTRSEFTPLLENHPHLHQVWSLKKADGWQGLLKLCRQLNLCSFTRIYDAHNNLRSFFVSFYLFFSALKKGLRPPFREFRAPPLLLRRSIRRWKRFLLFRLRINLFEQPFSGQRDLLEPLKAWGIPLNQPPSPQLFLPNTAVKKMQEQLQSIPPFVALAPSAAFALKRWPLDHWKTLLQESLKRAPSLHFVILGGPEDGFLEELTLLEPSRIHSMVGKLNLEESAAVVGQSVLLIANDTGLLHVGEQLGHSTIALMGPAPFGFPSRRESTQIMELHLSCRPCSKHGQGPCRNAQFQWCLVGITPEAVLNEIQKKLPQYFSSQAIPVIEPAATPTSVPMTTLTSSSSPSTPSFKPGTKT